MKISRDFHYDSAHLLLHVPEGHKCGRLHGHTYILTVTVQGPVDDVGWVMDFADVDSMVKPLVDALDHRYLNEIIDNPTVENQLLWLWDKMSLPGLCELRLQEGLNNSACYTGGSL